MQRIFWIVAALMFVPHVTTGQEILRGKIVKLDTEGKKITVAVDGKDHDYSLDERTRFFDSNADTLAERLKVLEVGKSIMLKPTTVDGREVLEGIKLADAPPPQRPAGNNPPGGPRTAVFKKLDTDKRTVTLEAEGKELVLAVVERTEVRNDGATQDDRLSKFKADDKVLFLATKDGDRDVLTAIARQGAQGEPPSTTRVTEDTSHLKPLTELGTEKYQGFAGGLYPDGKNERPAAHEAAGLRLAAAIKPLNAKGEPDEENGRVVLMSIGMSNTSQVSSGFRGALREASGVNSRFTFLDGAQGGMTAAAIQDPDDGRRGAQYWGTIDQRLKEQGLTREQVQIVWIKQADAGPSEGFPGYAQKLEKELQRIVQVVHERFPNVKLAYLSSRTYGGYATSRLNPEPYAFESGFSVKWLIEKQLAGDLELNFDPKNGDVKAPWLSWGPYLWANGTTKRAADGFISEQGDFGPDGTHHTSQGIAKYGELLLTFFRTDSTTRGWFNAAK